MACEIESRSESTSSALLEVLFRIWIPEAGTTGSPKWKVSYLGKTRKVPDLHEVRALEALVADVIVDVRKDLKIDRQSRTLCLTIVVIWRLLVIYLEKQ